MTVTVVQVLQCGEQQARDHHGRAGGAGCGRHSHLAKAEAIPLKQPCVLFHSLQKSLYIYFIYLYDDVFLYDASHRPWWYTWDICLLIKIWPVCPWSPQLTNKLYYCLILRCVLDLTFFVYFRFMKKQCLIEQIPCQLAWICDLKVELLVFNLSINCNGFSW